MGVIWVDMGVIWGNMGSYGGHIGVLWGGKCRGEVSAASPDMARGNLLAVRGL